MNETNPSENEPTFGDLSCAYWAIRKRIGRRCHGETWQRRMDALELWFRRRTGYVERTIGRDGT